jgi:hypothetical protein
MGGMLCLLHRLTELFYCVSWIKLMQILKGTGTDWRKRRLISKLYVDKGIQVRLDQGELGSVEFGRRVS